MGNLLGKKVPKKPPCTEFRDCPDELDSCIKNFQEGCEGLMAQCVLDTDCNKRSEIRQRHPYFYMDYSPTRLGSVSKQSSELLTDSQSVRTNGSGAVVIRDHNFPEEARVEASRTKRKRESSASSTLSERIKPTTTGVEEQGRTTEVSQREKQMDVVQSERKRQQSKQMRKMSGKCHHSHSPDSLPEGTCCAPGGYVKLGQHEPGRSQCKRRPRKII